MKRIINSGNFVVIFSLIALLFLGACKAKKPISQIPPAVESAETDNSSSASSAELDTDGDGIPDSKDNCPNKAGVAGNNGCPDTPPVKNENINQQVEPTFNYKNILFEFNSSVLKTSSYPILDEIAREMKKYPGMNFNLNGHSSAEGTEQRNMTLSVDRATAVKSYLVGLGINSANLEVKGFGESMPISENKTESGRELNRRVEIKKRQ